MSKYIRVAVSVPIRDTFIYYLPEDMNDEDRTGYAVLVPFGKQKVTGFVLGEEEQIKEDIEIKPIIDVLSESPIFTKKMVKFFEWISEYYFYPIGQVIHACVPSLFNVSRFYTATVTKKGEKAVEKLPQGSEEKNILLWIMQNHGKKVEVPVRILKKMEEKGWIKLKRQIRKKQKGPLMRKFIRISQGLDVKNIFDELGDEEKRLISMLHKDKEVPVFRLKNEFKNIYYLVKKLQKRGIIKSFDAPVYKNVNGSFIGPIIIPEKLEKQQQIAISRIVNALNKDDFSVYLLFGVAGSGKTEVYFRATEAAISKGKQVIIMLPEISLAVYMESLFRARLGKKVAIYHSKLSDGERYEQWIRMVRGEVDVVIGARSALFAPLPRLGLIVVDEEHDPSYKQETIPYYQARDLAVVRAQIERAVVVLGSATPSVQSYHNCMSGKYKLILMKKRVDKRPLPDIELVDMRNEKSKGIFSEKLISAIEENLKKNEQTILFFNKRGFYRLYVCRGCGKPVSCPNCEVSLVYHLRENQLKCHYCGYYTAEPDKCQFCGGRMFRTLGFGTERVEKEIAELFPEARLGRMDTDSVRKKGSIARLLRRFLDREIDILIGTQMVTKGYHFPHVTLVGVIHADISLLFPDFRASEWTFQLLSQVAGRAGRGEQKGRVIIQTYNPEHYSIQSVVRHDYLGFFKEESKLRSALKYPPFSHLICLRFQGNKKDEVVESAFHIAELVEDMLKKDSSLLNKIELLGPAEAPIPKIKGKFRWHIFLKTFHPYIHSYVLKNIEVVLNKFLRTKAVTLIWDVDPYYML